MAARGKKISIGHHKLNISILLGIAISIISLYISFRYIPLNDLLDYLLGINYFWIGPSVLIVILSLVLRVLRWQIILGPTNNVTFWSAFHALMISFMINTILPGRVGELARPAILKKSHGINYSTGLATIAAERTFDLIIIITLFLTVMYFIRIDPNVSMTFGDFKLNRETLDSIITGFVRLSLCMVVGILLVCINKSREWINKVIMKAPYVILFYLDKNKKNLIVEKICVKIVIIVNSFASVFQMIKSPKKVCVSFALSAMIWLLLVLSYSVLALGCPGINVNFIEMATVLVIVCVFIALPSVPGYWGLWEAGGIFALTLFGVSGKEAAGYTLTNHIIQLIPVIIIGTASAWITGINIFKTTIDT